MERPVLAPRLLPRLSGTCLRKASLLVLTGQLLLASGCALFQAEQPTLPVTPITVASAPTATDAVAKIAGSNSQIPPRQTTASNVNSLTTAVAITEIGTEIGTEIEGSAPASIWSRLQQQFTFPDCSHDAHALIWQRWYQNHPDYLLRVFQRAQPWMYMIMEEIEARDLPAEFALLPAIESAFNVFALSPAGAHGAWQMTLPTAQDYGLAVHDTFDGRRDMVLATAAALTMLEKLMQDFDGNWRLTLAAYNAGPARVARAVKKASGQMRDMDPARLALPRETKTYAPKLHGLVCLLRQSDIGIELPQTGDAPLLESISLKSSADLIEIAHYAEMDITALYTLNAGLNGNLTPPGAYALKMPLQHIESYQQARSKADRTSTVSSTVQSPASAMAIIVQPGDTLGSIAKRQQVSVARLRQYNQLKGSFIKAGQPLLINSPMPGSAAGQIPDYAKQLAQLQAFQNSHPGVKTIRHRIGNRETLSTIARRYRVSVGQLQAWNNINNPNRIRTGKSLLIHTSNRPNNSISSTDADDEYRVRRGDSLWKIARHYKLSVNQLKIWNRLPEQAILHPGQLLKLRP